MDIAGVVNGLGLAYSIASGGASGHLLLDLDPDAFPPDVDLGSGDANLAAKSVDSPGDCIGSEDEPVDVLVLYSAATVASPRSVASVENEMHAAIATANAVLANSAAAGSFRLDGFVAAPIDEVGDAESDFNAIKGDATAATLREQYGADIVTFLTEAQSACGATIAQRYATDSAVGMSYAPLAYNIVRRDCALRDLAHELEHNIGLEHNVESAIGTADTAAYPYVFAHYVYDQFRDNMSYTGAFCPSSKCPRQLFISNPALTFNGVSTGTLEADADSSGASHDARRAHDALYACVNQFRASVVDDSELPLFADGFE